MSHRFHCVKNKLSSLAPLHTQNAKSPWWILADYQHPLKDHREEGSVESITTGELLQIMLDILHIGKSSQSELPQNFWQSDCARFCVGCDKPTQNASCLYVQKRTDYLSCVELYVDGELAVSFREPVWPHLQHRSANPSAVVEVLTDTLVAMKKFLYMARMSKTGALAESGYEAVRGNPFARDERGQSAA